MQELFDSQWKEITENAKQICILGGGTTGNSVVNFFKDLQKEFFVLDSKPQDKSISYFSDVSDPLELPIFDLVIKSPGFSPEHPILQFSRSKGIPILSEIFLARLFFSGKILGITGTDGKSTTTALTAHILETCKPGKSKMGGNIGTPFVEFCKEPLEYAVLELSSYQLEDSLPLHLHSSAYLNLAEDHLERHKTMENYHAAKLKIATPNNPNHTFIVNESLVSQIPKNIIGIKSFGYSPGCAARIIPEKEKIETVLGEYSTGKFPLKGSHNLENLAASILLCESIGLMPMEIESAYESFEGLKYRFQIVHKYKKTIFINDSKATNLHSLLNGLKGFQSGEGLVIILGGRPKEEPIFKLKSRLVELTPKKVYIYGEAGYAWKELYGLKFVEQVSDPKEALHSIYSNYHDLKPEFIIFSPGCASFDLYRNFEERGEKLNDEIKKIFKS